MCCVPQRCVLFRYLNCQKWSENGVFCIFSLRNVFRATTACNFSSFIWPVVSAPAALTSLFFDPPEPQIIGKNAVFRDFPTFSRICIFFFLIFSFLFFFFLIFFFSLPLPYSTFHLYILSEIWFLNFLRKYNKLSPKFYFSKTEYILFLYFKNIYLFYKDFDPDISNIYVVSRN